MDAFTLQLHSYKFTTTSCCVWCWC